LKGKTYHGVSESAFSLQHVKNDLRIDFTGSKIHKLFVNQAVVENVQFDGNSITIPKEILKEGANTVAVVY
jgi:hypothetical protein